MVQIKVSVQADSSYVDRFDEVARQLRDAGMTIHDEIAVLGHFSGVADQETIEKLKVVPGVADVKVTGDEGSEDDDEYSIADE